jgi:hypothetical protein
VIPVDHDPNVTIPDLPSLQIPYTPLDHLQSGSMPPPFDLSNQVSFSTQLNRKGTRRYTDFGEMLFLLSEWCFERHGSYLGSRSR